jgi:hypothetical protein
MVEIIGSYVPHFQKYRLCKLMFFTSPKTNIKHVFLVELSYLKLGKFKLSATNFFGKKINHSILGKKKLK